MATASVTSTLVLGEALADIVVDPDGQRHSCPGGSPANVALGLARLGHPVRLATRIGRDPLGQLLRSHLTGSGVELSPGSVVDAATSSSTVSVDADGSAGYAFDIHWELPPSVVALTGPAAHLHTGSLAALLAPGAERVRAAVGAARGRATVSYDPNLRPDLLGPPGQERPRVEHLVAASDVVKASADDLDWLYPGQDIREVAARWARSGPRLVVLTRGGAGAQAWWPGGRCELPPTPVKVVDTIGAGDAFMAGLLSGLLRAGLLGPGPGERPGPREHLGPGEPDGPSPLARLRAATAGPRLDPDVARALSLAGRVAALTCTRRGADPPTRAEAARCGTVADAARDHGRLANL